MLWVRWAIKMSKVIRQITGFFIKNETFVLFNAPTETVPFSHSVLIGLKIKTTSDAE